MAGCCHDDCCSSSKGSELNSPRWRRALWVALAINAGMFLAEIVAGVVAGSASLQADAIDFLGDSANYAISLGVAGMALTWRARAALLKGWSLGRRRRRADALPLSEEWREYAFAMDLITQRCDRQSCCACGRRWCVRHRHGLAGPHRSHHHGRAQGERRLADCVAGTRGAARRPRKSGRNACGIAAQRWFGARREVAADKCRRRGVFL